MCHENSTKLGQSKGSVITCTPECALVGGVLCWLVPAECVSVLCCIKLDTKMQIYKNTVLEFETIILGGNYFFLLKLI